MGGVTGVLSRELNASKWVGCLIEFTWKTQCGWEFNGVMSNASKVVGG